MLPPPVMLVSGLFDQGQFWSSVATAAQSLATMASGVALWAQQRAKRTPEQDITDMVRRPRRWAARHPVISVRRKMDRRKAH